MILCSCHAVSDREIDARIARGCHSVGALAKATGAGSDCGSCVRDLERRLVRAGVRPERPADAERLAAK